MAYRMDRYYKSWALLAAKGESPITEQVTTTYYTIGENDKKHEMVGIGIAVAQKFPLGLTEETKKSICDSMMKFVKSGDILEFYLPFKQCIKISFERDYDPTAKKHMSGEADADGDDEDEGDESNDETDFDLKALPFEKCEEPTEQYIKTALGLTGKIVETYEEDENENDEDGDQRVPHLKAKKLRASMSSLSIDNDDVDSLDDRVTDDEDEKPKKPSKKESPKKTEKKNEKKTEKTEKKESPKGKAGRPKKVELSPKELKKKREELVAYIDENGIDINKSSTSKKVLEQLCENAGLKKSGNKPELVERITEFLKSAGKQSKKPKSSEKVLSDDEDEEKPRAKPRHRSIEITDDEE